MSESKVRTGACLCGKVAYRLEGPAATPLFNAICHCTNCRRYTGAPLYAASVCSKDGFRITQGQELLTTYTDNATASGSPLQRQFCSECGGKLFNLTPLFDSVLSIAAGSLDDFESWKPDLEQWCIHRAGFIDKIAEVDGDRRHIRDMQSEAES